MTSDKAKVRKLLAEGYGSEDIAIKLRWRVTYVRGIMQRMREAGELAVIYGEAKKKPPRNSGA